MYEQIDVDTYRSPGPSALHSATELPRVLMEMTSLAYTWPWLGCAPRGDGHPVLVVPGFAADDTSTILLRRFLERLGYLPLEWGLGRNIGTFELQERLFELLQSLTDEYDETISLVGQSLGGVYARELARQFPDRIRQVITLGSPFSATGPDSTHPLVGQLFQRLSGLNEEEMRAMALRFDASPPPVPMTAIYSRTDGIVHWSACLEGEAEQAENIEVIGSHTGMAVNPLVFHVIADRLAQPEGSWQPFEHSRGWRGLMFPRPSAAAQPRPSNGDSGVCASRRSTLTGASTN
jgi:pimeloyl-ACP methyl ester carboxylesterase